MYSGFYTIASGMLTQQRNLDLIGNNLVNLQTPGYRGERLVISSFEETLLTRKEMMGSQTLGKGATAVGVDNVATMFHAGPLKTTDNPSDLAIEGEGFFNIEGANGETCLTRNGSFQLDEDGYLVLPSVGKVMGTTGPLQIKDASFTVNSTGEIYDSQNRYIGALRLTKPMNGAQLQKMENGTYRLNGGGELQPVTASVKQGVIELSNIDVNREMTVLMEAQRAFQSCSSALQMIDSMNRKAVSEVGSI